MPRPKADQPLVRKLAQAFRAVGKLQRAGTNQARGYKFTRASDVFEAVRAELFSRDVLIIPNESTPEYVKIGESNGGEQITECRLAVSYVFRDTKEELPPILIHGAGRDVDDKAIFKAQTGAQKALLKRFGLIAEDADDPEWDGQRETGETLEDVAPRRVPRKAQPLKEFEIRALTEAMEANHKPLVDLYAKFSVMEIGRLKRGQFKDALAWASNGAGTLAPKPQAAPALQANLPLPKPVPPIELKIGNKSIEFTPDEKKAFSL
jgi:ERF superfamily